ncbi:aminotransferase class I/II-fold pyridoxal phosphate-dependent enzyme [Candidatus Falkowbacteria bacterium]|nr:aminotransferase class I/II-fold pyridoxal phosphate-dependent enzyme [Candidatus Falkowbacteria bacterium]
MSDSKENNRIIAGLLLGRAGSVGFPGKNTYQVLGRPLMVYPMIAGLNSKYVDKIFFSTDSEEYKEIGRKYGLEIINRPAELATKQALGEDAFAHGYQIIKEFYRQQGKEVELLVLFFCNAATILSETIDQGIAVLKERPDFDSAVTVSPYNMWSPLRARRENSQGLLEPFVAFETFGDPRTLNCDRDSQGDVWFADMGVSIVRPRCLENLASGLLPQKWMGQKIYPLKQWGGCDVDFEWQIPGVVYWLNKHGFTERATPYDFKNFKLPTKKHLLDLTRVGNPQQSRLEYLRLDKNENLIPMSSEFLDEIKRLISPEFISAYPELDALYKKTAKSLGVAQEYLYITAGSDAGIKAAFEIFVEPDDKVMTLWPTYAMYDVYTKMFQAKAILINYEDGLCINTEKIINQIEIQKPKLICLANPNSPTGTVLSPAELEKIINRAAANRVIVLIDEAYYPYYSQTAIHLIKKYPNLMITRTFSKAQGLAAGRLGFVVSNEKIIECLHKVRPMYEANAFGVRFAEYIIDHPRIVENNLRETAAGKEYLEKSLAEMNLPFHKSYANFINIKVGSHEKSVQLEQKMREQKILIKSGVANCPLSDCIRVSIGNVEQMKIFINALKQTLGNPTGGGLINDSDELLKVLRER